MVAVCNDAALVGILSIVKRILQLVQIIVPIFLIIMASINFTNAMRNPDDKKILKKIINSFLAAAVVFMVPVVVNTLIGILGEKTAFSNCWNEANESIKYSSQYIETDDNNNKTILINPSSYEKGQKQDTSSGSYSSYSGAISVTSCGSLEYCNKYLTSLYNNAQRLNEAILKNNASVVYSNDGDPKSWDEAIKVAQSGGTVKISCNRPSHWSMRDITGEYRDFWSKAEGGFKNYAGPMTNYTKQLTFDGSKSVKTAIQEGIIQPGDIIGTTGHTFTIYTVDRSSGSAVVFDGGHKYTGRCQSERKCAPIINYSAGTNANYKLYQIIRWIK